MATTGDVVLVHVDNKPGFYARIDDINPDEKPGWWQVRLLVLTFPLQIFTWILDEFQIEGEPFTMGGTPICLEKIVSPRESGANKKNNERQNSTPPREGMAKVVSLLDRRKK